MRENKMIDVGKIYESGFRDGEQSKWIPCSEKMPEHGEVCLITYKYNGYLNVERACYEPLWSGDKCPFSLMSYGAVPKAPYEVIAWMTLPKPYEG
jgi:hypothetical protein